MPQKIWTRDELLIAFNLYCRIPFGKLHHRNPEIIELSQKLGRTPSAIAMKLVNFASFDPTHKKRNISGLSHAGKGDRLIWDEFNHDWEKLAFESQQAVVRVVGISKVVSFEEPDLPKGPTESLRTVRVRLVQGFFRDSVLSSYKYTCSFCNLAMPEMLCASHIIPWAKNIEKRADPRNGICLCSFHDRAFDRGLVTVDENLQIVISNCVHKAKTSPLHDVGFIKLHGKKMLIPERFGPDVEALDYHRNKIFHNI
ncbi:MAG: HNH endonuclease [Phycisphaerae bacterium]|jgi:predicted restriction endonuclease